jgi:hypothetical protein
LGIVLKLPAALEAASTRANNQAGIDRKPFPADKTSLDARPHHALEHAAKDVAVAEPLVRPREGRMIRDLVFDPWAANAAIVPGSPASSLAKASR